MNAAHWPPGVGGQRQAGKRFSLERRETSVVALGTARAAENTGGPCDGHPWIGYVVNEPRIIRGKNP